MANDPVSIANRAATLLGVKRIVALTEASSQARSFAAVFDQVRDAELRAHVWNFALKRAVLAALSTNPLFGFAYQYPLPVDSLQVVNVGDRWVFTSLTDYRGTDESAFSIEGRNILYSPVRPNIATDPALPPSAPQLNIRYVAHGTMPSTWDALFCEALACALAIACCMDLTESDTKLQSAMAFYKVAIRRAVSVNAIEKPPQPSTDDSWIISRLAG